MLRGVIVGLARQPLLQFVVLGALLGLALHWMTGDRAKQDDTTIRITATDVARLDAG